MNKPRNQAVDPVIIVMIGVLLVAAAIGMVLITSNPASENSTSGSGVMNQLVVAFITGITTGGLSCLAVQGGLLASSLAHQIERDYSGQTIQKRKKHPGDTISRGNVPHTNSAGSILLFLGAKITAYTLLGALLGWLGSFLTLSPMTRAILMIAIGIFMVGNGLRMFNVHPIFRYFSIEPPKFITRYIRRTARGTDAVTPVLLGLLTVLIPCGVTQAMMATALGAGSAWFGAGLMFSFTLGTSPVFFIVAYLATELGARLEKFFMRFVAAVVLILGLITMNSGLNLVGSPLSFSNLVGRISGTRAEASSLVENQFGGDGGHTIYVRNDGYFPQTIRVPAGQVVTLNLVTDRTYSCSRDFVIPELNFYQLLPDTGTVQVDIPARSTGTRILYTCSMGMYTGQILFE